MEQQNFGKRIMMLRKEKGYTIDQLASKTGVSAQTVSKWEDNTSRPDIMVLPILAEAFGITTDELLSTQLNEPHVVVTGSSKTRQNDENGYSTSTSHEKRSGIWIAITVILVGLVFLLSRMDMLPDGAVTTLLAIVWPSVMIGLGISWFIKSWSPLGIGVGALGLYFLLFNLGVITYVLSWRVIWPVLIILLGLTILFDNLLPKRRKWRDCRNHHRASSYTESDGFIRYSCAFSEDHHRVANKQFAGADIDLSFGKSVLDLTQVNHVLPNSLIDAEISFGSLEIFLPRSIHLQISSDKAFGSIRVNGGSDANAPYTILMDGDVSFGSLTIRYI